MPIDRAEIGRPLGTTSLLVTRSRLRWFARATAQTDPVYLDVDAAAAAGHPDLPVPPTFLFSIQFEAEDPFGFLRDLGVDLRRVLHGEQEFVYHRVVHAGEEVVAETRIADVYDRRGGALEFLVTESLVRVDGELVAELRATTVVTHAFPAREEAVMVR